MLEFLYNLFCTRRKPKRKAAGCFFTDGKHVLAGYQPYKKNPIISGIGGTCEFGESWFNTTIREMFEELFDIQTLPKEFVSRIYKEVPYRSKHTTDNYTFSVYSFKDLRAILKIASEAGFTSPFYPKGFPTTIADLVFRRDYSTSTEVCQLVLLPYTKTMVIDEDFIKDIQALKIN